MENFYGNNYPMRNQYKNNALKSLSNYLSNTQLPLNKSCNALDIKNSLKERIFLNKEKEIENQNQNQNQNKYQNQISNLNPINFWDIIDDHFSFQKKNQNQTKNQKENLLNLYYTTTKSIQPLLFRILLNNSGSDLITNKNFKDYLNYKGLISIIFTK